MRILATSLTLLSALSCAASAVAAAPDFGVGACPISLDVRHSSGAYTQTIDSDGDVVAPSRQVLEFTIHNDALAKVTLVKATLQMRSGEARTQSLAPSSQPAAKPGERIPVELIPTAGADRSAMLLRTIANRNAVDYVMLDEVDFADGTRWTAAGHSACRFSPNPVLLIAAQ